MADFILLTIGCGLAKMLGIVLFGESFLSHDFSTEIDNFSEDDWNRIILDFDDASIYQTWAYADVRWGQRSCSQLVLRNSTGIVAAAHVRIVRVPVFGYGIAYVPWGPMWRRAGEADVETFRHMLRAIRLEYANRRGLLVRITPPDWDDLKDALRTILAEERFSLREDKREYRTLIWNLADSEGQLRKTLSKSWRRSLKKSEAGDLCVRMGTEDHLLQECKTVYLEMLSFKRFIDTVDIDEFIRMQKRLPDALKMSVILCDHGSQTVSAEISSLFGNRVVGLFLATGTEGRKLCSANRAQWERIMQSKRMGYSFYDDGGYNPIDNPSVSHFKKGMGGQEHTHLGTYESCDRFMSAFLVASGERLRVVKRRAAAFVHRLMNR